VRVKPEEVLINSDPDVLIIPNWGEDGGTTPRM